VKITGARVATGATTSQYNDLRFVGPDLDLDLSGHLILPGLINAHDHLELNLFPPLGTRIYSNAADWAADIYHPEKSPVREHAAVPKRVRLLWGAIKNLVCGVTTVAHHNPYQPEIFDDGFPVHVLKEFGWAHSLAFSPDVTDRFLKTPEHWPFCIHAAEGTDASARLEISRLHKLGILSRRTVLIHANGAGPDDVELIRSTGCSVAWCPGSNLATYGSTLSPHALHGIPMALGTDSSLTAGTDLLDELRTARERGASPHDLYRMVTCTAAAIFRLPPNRNHFVAVQDKGQSPAEAIFHLNPELVIVSGEIRLISHRLSKIIPKLSESFHAIAIENRGSWLIDANVPQLMRETAEHLGTGFRLAGKLVS
jgi:cytosine/adenosine deaminase-related metal-dependent hydrolase